MWSSHHTIVTDASKESMWQIWADVDKWRLWDEAVEQSELSGEFATGARFMLKPDGGPAVAGVIMDCRRNRSFSGVTSLPLAKMEFVHEMVNVADGVQLTHGVNISGPLSFVWARVIGKKSVAGLPSAMNNLVRLAKGLDIHA